MDPLHRRVDDDRQDEKGGGGRGRHLVATRPIDAGSVVFVERPLLSLQSVGNSHAGALVCRRCRSFVGGPDLGLAVASGRVPREGAYGHWERSGCGRGTKDGNDGSGDASKLDGRGLGIADETDCYRIVPCRNYCGELFCSSECEADMWDVGGHSLLCTGLLPDPDNGSAEGKGSSESGRNVDVDADNNDADNGQAFPLHPLLQFKVHAVQNNEILLMVADLVATAVSIRRRQLLSKHRTGDEAEHSLDDVMAPYLDFTLVPWWEVATAPLLASPTGLIEASRLDVALRRMCRDSASLLREAILSAATTEEDDGDNDYLRQAVEGCDAKYGIFTELFFGKIIGSFEQNAMGIRVRHPLCRDVFDKDVRERCHDDVVRCIEAAGMIGDCDEEGGDEDEGGEMRSLEGSQDNDNTGEPVPEQASGQPEGEDEDEEYDYTIDDIAEFVSGIEMNEDGNIGLTKGSTKSDDDGQGDDLDAMFTPLDGTAMYYTTCKMNHSCHPNIVARYRYSSGIGGGRWGKSNPLVVECVALRDIAEGEECTISYISSDDPLEKRKEAIANYGFACNCVKCHAESSLPGDNACTEENNPSNLFVEDSDDADALFGSDDEGSTGTSDSGDGEKEASSGETLLQERLECLINALNSSLFGRLPVQSLASAASFILQVGATAQRDMVDAQNGNCNLDLRTNHLRDRLLVSLKDCIRAAECRDFGIMLSAGAVGEGCGLCMLQEIGSWPNTSFREAYWCCSTAAALALADGGHFLGALQLLDKAAIVGLPRKHIKGLFAYVEYNAAACAVSPGSSVYLKFGAIHSYRQKDRENSIAEGLVKPIAFPVEETDISALDQKTFHEKYVSTSEPVVIRNFAHGWPAMNKWRDLDYLAREHGHRIVPIELGSMMKTGGMTEKMMTIREFVSSFLVASNAKMCWPIVRSDEEKSSVAYLAQHQLFEQIPILLNDIDPSPSFCGECPAHVNVWLGTGGTRTPLHFDSFDNLLVQIAGIKYVRIYKKSETEKLYVKRGDSTYGKQGNMSALDCELEDFDGLHPKARDAEFVELIMMPGDCLFIPARVWHYVRSLTTSCSVNFWW